MGESNGPWSQLGDTEAQDQWDTYEPIPEEGNNDWLDALVKEKGITHAGLVSLGARLSDSTVLAVAFPGGIKYRSLVDGRRWATAGARFAVPKLLRQSGAAPTDACLVAEGETDAVRLWEHYDQDVAVLPRGAAAGAAPRLRAAWAPEYAEVLAPYGTVYLMQDADAAGDTSAAKFEAELNGRTARVRPDEEHNDWCATPSGEMPSLPVISPEGGEPVALDGVVTWPQLLDLEVPDVISYFENGILPIGGSMIIHGSFKMFKTWLAMDLATRLATGQAWANFEAIEEPARVCYLNFELTWPEYRDRIDHIQRHYSGHEALLAENFTTYSPMRWPNLVAGAHATEDPIIEALLEAGVTVALLDPVRRAMTGSDMNAEADVQRIFRFTDRLNAEGIATVLTHHDNKSSDSTGGGDPTGMTGSAAFGGGPSNIVSVGMPAGETDRNTCRTRNLYFTLRSAAPAAARSFELTEDCRLVYTREIVFESAGGDQPEI